MFEIQRTLRLHGPTILLLLDYHTLAVHVANVSTVAETLTTVQDQGGSLFYRTCDSPMVTDYSVLHLPMWSAKPHGALHTKPNPLAASSAPDYPKIQELRHFNQLLTGVFAFFMVMKTGIEPATHCLEGNCSTN